MKSKETNNKNILGMRVDVTSYRDVVKQILKWAVNGENRYVCVANVHMVMEAYQDATLRKVVNKADLVTPDGMPLVWMLRRLGHPLEDRVYGPTLTLRVLEAATSQCIPVGFYGGAPDVLAQLVKNVQNRYKNIQIAYRFSPPFCELTPEEDKAIVHDIEASQTRILFVGLGCPKQEQWMAAHVDRMQAVMLGVGAAFDFHAGKVRQAPNWLQNKGLEWLFRLFTEPGRLWKRYLKHNPRFAVLGMMELARKRRRGTVKVDWRF
jgi:N-acetylglucosaminyldiphosphoundecaprenol N-acetyl-beta-D-mannosaminyltransferase